MSKRGAVVSGSLMVGLCAGLAAPSARADVPDTPAWNANTGFVTSTGIAILIPDEGSAGGGLELSGRYGIPVGPFIMAPGARIGGYYVDSRVVGTLMPMFRITAPLGPLAPFVHGGVGAGGLTNPGDGGVAWLGGGGLMIHFGGVVSIGAEVNYSGITGTPFKVLSIGPVLVIGG